MPAWNETDDRKLLLACIKLSNQTPNWDEVGALIGRTGESIRQRYMKLKKEAGEFTAGGAADDGSVASPAVATPTPKKRKSKAKAKKLAVSDEEDDEEGTPLTKKTKKSQKIIKTEDEEEAEA